MKKETYNGWHIVTERSNGLCDIIENEIHAIP